MRSAATAWPRPLAAPVLHADHVQFFTSRAFWVGGSFLALPLDGAFDAAAMWYVIEHLTDPAAFVTRSQLRPGGHRAVSRTGFAAVEHPRLGDMRRNRQARTLRRPAARAENRPGGHYGHYVWMQAPRGAEVRRA